MQLTIIAMLIQLGGLSYAEEPLEEDSEDSAEIQISGVSGVLKKNIEARLPAFKPECESDQESLEKYKKAVRNKLKKSTRALGYYHASADINARKQGNCWLVDVKIKPGKPVIVITQDIRITGPGIGNPEFKNIKQPYKTNDVLNHQKYSDYKTTLTEVAQEKGYLGANFLTKEILVDLKKNTAKLSVHFDTGKRYRYGEIKVEQEILQGKYLDRYIRLKTGEYFSSTAMIEQQQLLQSSGYYSSVSVQADYKNAKNAVIPINILLTSAKRDHYRVRFGYGTDTGFRSKLIMDRRWTGSAGKKLNTTVGLSQRINELTTQLTVPKSNPSKNNLFYTASIKREENDDIISDNIKFGVVLTSIHENEWRRSVSLTYLSDRTKVEDGDTTKSNLTLFGNKYTRVKADNKLFPRNGWRMQFEAEGALDKILSDASVLRLRAEGKYITQLGKGRLLLRGDIGATLGDALDDLPKDLRFFAGGINSIRGYAYESLGEINEDGKVIGGKRLLEASIEYEHPISEQWSVAGFVDGGNAFDEFNTQDIEVGVGAGLRWRSPIGPVRLDFGVPHDDTSDLHLHLSIGPDL